MDTKKIKEGVSVKEIEGFAKKHRFTLFFCLALILALIFSGVFFSGWSLPFVVLGGVLSFVWTTKIAGFLQKAFAFFTKQEDMTQLILGGACLIVAIFLPFVVFFLIGLCGAESLKRFLTPSSSQNHE